MHPRIDMADLNWSFRVVPVTRVTTSHSRVRACAGTCLSAWAAIAMIAVAGAHAPEPRQGSEEALAQLARQAREDIAADAAPFVQRAALVDRLRQAGEQAPSTDARGEFALLWLRSMRWLLAAIPLEAASQPPYRDWLQRHDGFVVYSEPAGQWLLNPDHVWATHARHRGAASAAEIAWLAVENGYPGECEGYVPCYANIMNWLEGEYLRRHPRGAHAGEAVDRIRATLNQAVRLLARPDGADFLSPPGDCGDLRKGLDPLRDALEQTTAAMRTETIALIDPLLARCPSAEPNG